MKTLLLSCIAFLLTSTVAAHDFIDNPNGLDGEPEAFTSVDANQVIVERWVDYSDPAALNWTNHFDGAGVGSRLVGQTLVCGDTNPRNRGFWGTTAGQSIPNGEVHGAPSYPIAISGWADSGPYTTFFYQWIEYPDVERGNTHTMANSSYADGRQCGEWGDDPWAQVNPEDYKEAGAVVMTILPVADWDGNCDLGERLHIEFWDDSLGHVRKVGHKDLPNGSTVCEPIVLAFTSTKPFTAFTLWTQNGQGFAVKKVGLGVPAAPPTPEQCNADLLAFEQAQDNAYQSFIDQQASDGCPAPL